MKERLIGSCILLLAILVSIAINSQGLTLILLLILIVFSGILTELIVFLFLCIGLGIIFLIIATAMPKTIVFWPIVLIVAIVLTAYKKYNYNKEPVGISISMKETKKQEQARKYAENILEEAKKKKMQN